MRGYLNMTFKEVDDRKTLQASVKCALEDVTTIDKFTIVHSVLKALEFNETDLHMLSIAVQMNIWPDSMLEEMLK